MLTNPSRSIKYLSYLLKTYVFEVICTIAIFLYGVNWRASGLFIVVLAILDYFILSVSKCGCFGSEDGCTYMHLHRTDGHCIYFGKKPVPITNGLAVFLNQNYNIYLVVVAMFVYYFYL